MERLRNHDDPQHPKSQNPNEAKEIPVKVKYISNPMMVKAKNESEFRAIVQKLTGQHSDIFKSTQIECSQTTAIAYTEHNQVFCPQPAMASADHKDYLISSDHLSLVEFDESCFWREGTEDFSWIQASYVDI